MDVKRTPQGQVVQENSEPLGSDLAPVNSEVGEGLRIGIVEGKSGSVTKLGMTQTDHTDEKAGPTPLY
jgi:hypothetical protein